MSCLKNSKPPKSSNLCLHGSSSMAAEDSVSDRRAKGVSSKEVAMPNDVVAKAGSSPILERFRELLRIREEEAAARVSPYDAPPPPTTDEIVGMYEDVLSELTLNSKPIITDLTIIAGEQREHADGIADAVSARIVEVPVEQKLPALYLLDSIIKNIGGQYVTHFSSRLPEVFCEAYRQVQPSMHRAMRRLFGTWSSVLPYSVLHRIEAELQFSPSANQQPLRNVRASESPLHAHGIHVNPKYVDDVNNVRGASPYKMYGRKPIAEYDDYESAQGEGTLPNIAAKRLTSNGYGSHAPLPLGGHGRSSSPLIDEYPGSNSPRGIVERASPSHVGFTYGLLRKTGGDGEAVKWRRSHGFENITVGNQNNGSKHDRTRALIDAYGQDNGQRTMDAHSHNVGPHRMNEFDGNMAPRPWQHTEEEEFDWQDLNPTLVDSRCADRFPSDNFRETPGVGSLGPASLTPSLRRSWPGGTHVSSIDEFPKIPEDSTAFSDAGRGSVSKHLQHETIQRSDADNPQGAWNLLERNTSDARGASSSATVRLLPHVPSGLRPPADIPKPQVTPLPPTYLPQNQISGQNTAANAPHLPASQGRLISSHHPVRPPFPFQQQFLPPHEPRLNAGVSVLPSFSQRSVAPTYGVGPGNQLMNPVPGMYPSMPPTHVSSSTSHTPGMLPPFPPGQYAARPQMLPGVRPSNTGPSPSGSIAYSGLINSLVSQGVISFDKQTPGESSIGVDFDQDLLKVRHESAIRALYEDLPRRCMTCGHRFKTQEEHSKHMDWHVTKNRMSKNRRQNPSRKWFVSTTMWLSSAEALGTDTGPGFLPTDTAEEKQDEEELAVPADENQRACALCGESFEDFYSDETDEWMYKGAVYLNAQDRSTEGMDSSQLGPIIHAKCRSESSTVPSRNFGQEEAVGYEGGQRKRMKM